jgi:hypothetical protein
MNVKNSDKNRLFRGLSLRNRKNSNSIKRISAAEQKKYGSLKVENGIEQYQLNKFTEPHICDE